MCSCTADASTQSGFSRCSRYSNTIIARVSTSLPAGEGVGFSVACENFQPSSFPRLPIIPGLRISGAGTGRSFQLGGGKRTSTLTYNFLITPTKTGTYTLPSLSIPSGQNTHKTKPLQLRVVTANSDERLGGVSDYAFVRLVVGKATAYVGEPIPVEIQLFFAKRPLQHAGTDCQRLQSHRL